MAMELTDEFVVPLAVADAWKLLTDVERIAPCLPGARLEQAVDGEYTGVVRVKVGPVTVQYKGTARFTELNETDHRFVLGASGRETRGQGSASATVTGNLIADGDSTKVELKTDLEISGKVAQFGRGVIADVSSKLLGQFVKNIENDLIAAGGPASSPGPSQDSGPDGEPVVVSAAESSHSPGEPDAGVSAPTAPGATASSFAPPPFTARALEPEPLKLGRVLGKSLAKRLIPGFAVLFLAALIRRLRKRRA
jgi:carbon monoxide dehydrogenase subunit G